MEVYYDATYQRLLTAARWSGLKRSVTEEHEKTWIQRLIFLFNVQLVLTLFDFFVVTRDFLNRENLIKFIVNSKFFLYFKNFIKKVKNLNFSGDCFFAFHWIDFVPGNEVS